MSKRCRTIVYGIIFCLLVFFVFVLFNVIHYYGIFSTRFELLGEDKVVLALNEPYKESGYEVYHHFTSYHDLVEINSNVSESKVGTYTINYEVPKLNKKIKRIVEVKDVKKPILTLNGEKTIYTFVNNEFIDEGATSFDDYDGNLDAFIKVKNNVDLSKEGEYKIIYSVSDKSKNEAMITRNVLVRKDPTKVSLVYDHDKFDNTAMQWWFHKSVDHKRKEGAIEKKILDAMDSYYIGEDEKVIYLTYDEGGSEKTYIKEIAHLLNRYEINATFFLTKNYILKEADFIRDLVANGHVVGNHTHNHLNMSLLASKDKVKQFSSEITSVEKAYMQVTGKEMLKIFRFPKGEASIRTMKMMQDMGYRTYFWSHAYYDYGATLDYQSAFDAMYKHYHNGAIYLMHPNNKGNYDALEDFIKVMLEKGYTFKTVDKMKSDVS